MNSINYQQYKEFRCDKCSDKYCARYGSYSDRTSCRFHYWEKDENGIIMCRDCKKCLLRLVLKIVIILVGKMFVVLLVQFYKLFKMIKLYFTND